MTSPHLESPHQPSRSERADFQATDDLGVLAAMGYSQELSRHMRLFSNFAISFTIICILAGGITSFHVGFLTGGPFMVTIGWGIGGLFALIVASSLAQIASAYPTAGGLYHWSSILGGRFWGWMTAWLNLIGLIFVIASVNVGVYSLFRDLVLEPVAGIDISRFGFWHQTIGLIAITASQGLCNHFGIKLTAALTDFSGYFIFFLTLTLIAVFLLFGARHFDLAQLLTPLNLTGSPSGPNPWTPRTGLFTALLIGMLYPLYTMTGFDASAHTSEETVNARHNVPRGMIHSVLWSLLFGFILTLSFVSAIPDWALAADSGPDLWFKVFNGLPLSPLLKTALAIGIVCANYLCALACITSTSRMVYAFARDGGLPYSDLFKAINARYRSPAPAIWLTVVLSIAATLYSPAFSALASGCALFLYISYAMPIAAGLFAEGKSWTDRGPFHLGRWSKPSALVSICGVVLLTYGGLQPPNDIVINYAVGVLVFLMAFWLGIERTRFQGPPRAELQRAVDR